jgi:hypothetical protein
MQICFYFNQIGSFSAVLCHLKVRRKNSGFIAATLYKGLANKLIEIRNYILVRKFSVPGSGAV